MKIHDYGDWTIVCGYVPDVTIEDQPTTFYQGHMSEHQISEFYERRYIFSEHIHNGRPVKDKGMKMKT